MTKILVTGAAGFIGRHTLAPLKARGFEIHGLAFDQPPAELADLATWHRGNLLQRDSVSKVLEQVRPEGLIHFAWESAHGVYWSDPSNLEWTAASLRLFADFVRAGGRRVVVGGTCAEYQWQSMPLTENSTPLVPASLYGHCKNAVREVLEAWAGRVGLSWAWGRMFFPFGPHEKPERLVPKVVLRLLAGKPLPFDDATSVRDFLDVRDVGDAFAALYASPVQGAVNIASGRPVSIRTIVEFLAGCMGAKSLVHFGELKKDDGQPASLTACTRRLNEEVGWLPQATLQERLAETFEWWRSKTPQLAGNPEIR